MNKNFSVLGSGSWGTVLANLLANNGNKVNLWTKNIDIFNSIKNKNLNEKYLPELKLNSSINVTLELKECFQENELILIAIPSRGIKELSEEISSLALQSNKFILASKGIDGNSFRTMSEIFSENSNVSENNIFVLSGPNLAKEISDNYSAASVLAGSSIDSIKDIAISFNTDTFKIFLSDDKKGVELAGALKNIYAISAGLSDGLGSKFNTKAMILTRSLSEMSILFEALGANPMTLLGLAGVGDLIATSSSSNSRNYSFGFKIGQGEVKEDAINSIGQVVEGINTLDTVFNKKNELNLSMPIVEELHKIIFNNSNPKDCFANIFHESNNIDS